jgi:hypothetical protein
MDREKARMVNAEADVSSAADLATGSSGVFRISPRWTQLVLIVGASVSCLCFLQFENVNVFWLMILFFLVIGTIYKKSWAIYLLLTILIFLKFVLVDPRDHYLLRFLQPLDLFYTMMALVFAAICFRYLELSRVIDAYFPRIGKPKSLISEPVRSTGSAKLFPSLLGGRWWLIPTSMAMAYWVLNIFPYDGLSPREWITVSGRRLIYMTFFLFFCWFVCRSVVALALRWNMEPAQASIRARSLIAKEFWNETYSVEKRLAKMRDRDRGD